MRFYRLIGQGLAIVTLGMVLYVERAAHPDVDLYAQGSFSTMANAEYRNAITAKGKYGTPRYATASLPTCDASNEGALATDSTLHTFNYCNGTAYVNGGFSGGTVSGATNFSSAVGFADGTSNAPSIAFTSDQDGTGTGFYRIGANNPGLSINGGLNTQWGANFVLFDAGSCGVTTGFNFGCFGSAQIGFVNAGAVLSGSTLDAFWTREGIGIIQQGADVNGTAVAQTYKAADAITGSNVIGAPLTNSGGIGTGNAVSGTYTVNRVATTASGTTAQTFNPAIVVCPSKILSNTSATAQTIATITTTTTTGGSVTFDYSVVANNGTLQDTDSGVTKVSWNNNAGTVAAAMTAVTLQSDSDASGTLAATPTATVATNVVSIKLTPTWVTIVPTTVTGFYNFQVFGPNTVVCQ